MISHAETKERRLESKFENTIAFLSDKNLKPSIVAQCVMQIPEEKRKYKNVRYSFWSPLGKNGYFNQ